MTDLKQTLREQLKKARAVFIRGSAARLARRDPVAAEAMLLEKRGDFAGAVAVWRKKLNGSGGAETVDARTLNFTIARLEALARHWKAAAQAYLAILAIAPGDARAKHGLEGAALRAAREAQAAKHWRDACDMWLVLAKVSADQAKAARNILTCARNGAREAEAQGDWEAAARFWQDCGTVDATSESGKKALERSLVYRARAAEKNGSVTQARESWATLLKLYPTDIRAKLGLLRAGETFEDTSRVDAVLRELSEKTQPSSASFYFDVSDIMMFFPNARSPTGIQRITLAVIDAAFSDDANPNTDIGICAFEHRFGSWKAVNVDLFRLLILLSREGADTTDQQWLSAVDEMQNDFATAPPLVFPKDGILVNLGSPWGVPNYFLAIREAKRKSNIFYAGFVHDTIPLLHPEYCHGDTAGNYATWLAGVGGHADFMLANAENTKRDFHTALDKIGQAPIPCEVVFPNGTFAGGSEAAAAEISDEVQGIIAGPYVLFVGTIEPRKDHLFVLTAWQRLLTELGPVSVPTLVIAGGLGWRCEPVVEFVTETSGLDGKLKMLNKVSDVELQALYRHALYTIYNSRYEGWGLPVTESLSYRKVPVLPRNSSLVESGGKHAIFYETNSQPSFMAVIRELIAWPDILKAREQEIIDNPPIRSWRAIFDELHAKVVKAAEQATDAASRTRRHTIKLGEPYPLRGRAARTSPIKLAAAEATRCGMGWHGIEDWGAWTCEKNAYLEFDIANFDTLPTGQDAKLHLVVGFRGRDENTRVELTIDDAPVALFDVPPSDWNIRLEFPASAIKDKRVKLGLNQNGITDLSVLTKGVDTRKVGVGVRSFMLCGAQDMASRMGFLEAETNYLTGGILY